MVTEYRLVRHGTHQLSLLEAEVNQLIKEGWQPQQTAILTSVDGQPILIQQMVKETPRADA